MKRSDTPTDTQPGSYVAGATPLGTVTEAMVVKRAKEIAVTNGRNANQYTSNDLDEARRELLGFPNISADEQDGPDAGGWLGEAGDRGARAPVRPPRDEQTFAENLVQEGVEEAAHHQMLAGNQYSRERDNK